MANEARQTRPRPYRAWCARCAAATALLAVAAATAGAQRREFSETTTVLAVEIPVQVLADGLPVRGLTREHFEVFEGRRQRAIVGFEVVDLSPPAPTAGLTLGAVTDRVSPAGRRHFLLLFDLSHSEPSALARARDAARAVLRDGLHPSDLVAVATYGFRAGARIVLGFTADRRQAELAIDTLGLVELRDRTPDPLGLQLTALEAPGAGGAGSRQRPRAEIDEAILENLRELAAAERSARRQVQQGEIAALTRGYAELARLMGALVGRKQVVLFSQGFESTALLGTASAEEQAAAGEASAFGEIWNVDSEQRFGNTRLQNQLEQMLGELRRADCVIQAVDISGLVDTSDLRPRASGRDTLFTMARDTGGQLFEHFNDLGRAMASMLAATSVTYVLTIEPQDVKLDGKFHELRVRLKGGPSGARLVHRPGYYAPAADGGRAPAARQLESSQLLLAGRSGGALEAATVVAPFRTADGRAHVPVVVEVSAPALGGLARGGRVPVVFYAYAFDASGAVRDFTAQSAELDPATVAGHLRAGTVRLVGDLLLPPGDYTVRVLTRAGEGDGRHRVEHVALPIPDLAAGGTLVTPALVGTPMTAGLLVRAASSAEKTRGLPFPFVDGESFFLPSALAPLRTRGDATFWLGVAGFGAGPVELDVELADAAGGAVAGAGARLVERRATPVEGQELWRVALSAGGAKPGPHTLKLSITQGERRAASLAQVAIAD